MFSSMQVWSSVERRQLMTLWMRSDAPASMEELAAAFSQGGIAKRLLRRIESCPVPVWSVVSWTQHGCQVYRLNEIVNALFSRAELDFKHLDAVHFTAGNRQQLDEMSRLEMSLRTQRAQKELQEAIALSGQKTGCVVLSFAGLYERGGMVAVDDSMASYFATKSFVFSWDEQGQSQVTIEGANQEGGLGYSNFSVDADNLFKIVAMQNEYQQLGVSQLHHLCYILAATAVCGLLNEHVQYYTPKRRGKNKRKGKGNSPSVRTCTIDQDRWSKRTRKPEKDDQPPRKRTAAPNHTPQPYDGPGYHVGVFPRRQWVLEENVQEGEQWVDIKERRNGKGILVQVWRDCNESGYTVGKIEPKVTTIKAV